MPTYVLRAGETEMVKIGWADEAVDARRLVLQTAHWEDMTILRVIEGDPWIERAMHRHFAEHRVRREWFRFHPDMLTIDPMTLAPKPKRASRVKATVEMTDDEFYWSRGKGEFVDVINELIAKWAARAARREQQRTATA